MRCFVAGDDDKLVAQIRDILGQLKQDCPQDHTSRLDGLLAKLVVPLQGHGGGIGRTVEFSTTVDSGGQAAAEPGVEVVVVVVLPPDIDRSLAVVRDVRQRTPAHILAVGPATDGKLVLKATRGGLAHGYLDQADVKAELQEALNDLIRDDQAPAPAGKIFAVLSASGGGGSSTLAANLAAVLAMQHRSCALLDLKLDLGDLATLLDLKPTYTITDVCKNLRKLDQVLFQTCLVPHSSGIQLLAAPKEREDVASVTPEGISQALTLASRHFPSVVVDVDASFRPEQTAVLPQADVILLVSRLDYASLRNTRRMLDYLEELGVSDRARVVINRQGQPSEMELALATKLLGVKPAHYIPDDPKTVNWTNNNGYLFVLQYPTARVSKAIVALGLSLAEQRPAR